MRGYYARLLLVSIVLVSLALLLTLAAPPFRVV